MYNRYINADGFVPPEPQAPEPEARSMGDRPSEPASRGLGGLKELLGDRFKLPDLNGDTLLLLALVYFLVADADDKISDTFLIIAALFLMGL